MKLVSSPKHHSAANGMVENAVQRVTGLTKVVKDALGPKTSVMTFMVNHAATIINRFSVDQDGKTPMEKARGTTANREMAEFGEKIPFQADDEVQHRDTRPEVVVRAVHWSSNETERDHGERSRRRRKSMDIQGVARGQKMGCKKR